MVKKKEAPSSSSEEEVEEVEESDEEESEEESEEDSDPDSLRALLDPFSKDQLISLLKETAIKNPSILARIAASASSDPVHRKVFVHGLSWDCTTPLLTAAFAPFGDIEDCRVVTDRTTGRSKGYGFVLFRTRSGARKALKDPQKSIGGRQASCQLASFGATKTGGPPAASPEPTGRKIFVSNVPEGVSVEKLRAFFAKFGEIEEGPLGFDRVTGKLRGFALFTYKTADGCKKALEQADRVFEGSLLRCQRALEGLNKAKTVGAPVGVGNDMGMMMGMNPLAMNVGVGVMSPSVGRNGVNTVSPSVIGSYQSLAAMQGLGTYQGSQIEPKMEPGMSSKTGLGSFASGFPSYYGH